MVGQQLEQAKSWQARMAALIESHHQLKQQQQQQNQQPVKTGKLGINLKFDHWNLISSSDELYEKQLENIIINLMT